jgi:signal transduction histidine kinase/AmiR/NasT family two-component response regulator
LQPSDASAIDSEQYMISLRNLTAQRQAEKAQLRAEKEATASQMKTEMMQMLSHELRTPLQGIMGVTSTLLIDMVPEEEHLYESVSIILASSRLLLTLINNVLDIRKMDTNMMNDPESSPVPVFGCLTDSIKFCEPFATLNEASLVLEGVEDDSWCVLANRLRLEQIMVNLISNGIKYTTTPRTDIVISARQCTAQEALQEALSAASSDLKKLGPTQLQELDQESRNVTVITVRDHGRGIPSSEFDKVFGEFMQLEISLEKDQDYDGSKAHMAAQSSGSGLGLNLVMKFVTRMKGHVWFNNCEVGGGVAFSICLPSAEATHPIEIRESSNHQLKHGLEAAMDDLASQLRVLVVDDSVINLKVLARMCHRLGVDHVETAQNGVEALQYLASAPRNDLPNLILSDLIMPEMDGFDFALNLREFDLPMRPLVIACSADWDAKTQSRCFNCGFDGILHKPIMISDLKQFLVDSAGATGREEE